MVIVWGQRMYGRIDRYAGSHVATRFFHIYYVPLIPLSSWLVLEEQAEGRFVGLPLPLQLRSIMVAWLRVLTAILVPVAAWNVLDRASAAQGLASPLGVQWTGILVGALALGVHAWIRLGSLDRADKAARVIYSGFSGRFVDVALLGEHRDAIKLKTIEELDRHVVKHATASYREAPQTGWRHLATRPDMRDLPLLKTALTRCRVEWSEARGAERDALAKDHARIFANIVAAAPTTLAAEQLDIKA